MIALSGADLVLPDRVLTRGSIVMDGGRIAAIEARAIDAGSNLTVVDVSNHTIVPGFIDVHLHGIEDIDVLDGPDAVDAVASRLPRYGVTAFCPTSIACTPQRLTTLLDAVTRARSAARSAGSARVLPAHLESNFINPEWSGAQPVHCLRTYKSHGRRPEGDFAGHEILQAIVSHRSSVGIVTIAPELSGGLDLVRDLVIAGHRVSLGHTGATYEEARAAIAAGALSASTNHAPPAAATSSSTAFTRRGPKRSIATPTGSWQKVKEKKYMLESSPSPPAERPNSAASVGASTAFTMRYTYETK